MFVMATISPEGAEIQAAINGFVDESLAAKLGQLEWPTPRDTSLYKQLVVLRAGSE